MEPTERRILIVDDEPLLLKMLQVYLGRLGYTVLALNSTDKAREEVEAATQGFDVAVLDASLKGLPMEDLARVMLAAAPRLCVIAASGYPVDITALQAAAPGRVMFLQKPFTAEMLGDAVRRMIASQEKDV